MKVNFWTATGKAKYNQIPAVIELQYSPAIVEKDGSLTEQYAPFICKDYFNEAAYHAVTGKPCSIYGFVVKEDAPKWGLDKFRAILTIPKQNYDLLRQNIHYLHEVEDRAKTERTDVFPAGKENKYVCIGSELWMQNAHMISAYTLILRWLCQDWFGKPIKSHSANRDMTAYANLRVPLLKVLDNIRTNPIKIAGDFFGTETNGSSTDGNWGMSEIHNRSGIQTILQHKDDCNKYTKLYEKKLAKIGEPDALRVL